MRTNPKKRFDCVELQDQGALAIYRVTGHMAREQELAYWAERTAALKRKQEALRRDVVDSPSGRGSRGT